MQLFNSEAGFRAFSAIVMAPAILLSAERKQVIRWSRARVSRRRLLQYCSNLRDNSVTIERGRDKEITKLDCDCLASWFQAKP